MNTKNFGEKLRKLRKQAGFSQRELAEKIGVNYSYLSKIESGAMPPPSEKVISRLAEILNTDKDELMTMAGKVPTDIARLLMDKETLQSLRSKHNKQKKGNKIGKVNIMKTLTSYKRLSRVALAFVLVAAMAVSLWFASPQPAKALTIAFPSVPSTGTLGENYNFQVKVNIESQDLLPVDHINMEIYNTNSPSSYKATVTNLPLNTVSGSASKSYSAIDTGGGAVSITSSSAYGWMYTSDANRKGYGYRDPGGWGWHDPLTPGFGYGYGYDLNQGSTSITFNINWASPESWPEGSYAVKVYVYGDSTQKFSGTQSFTLETASDDDTGTIPGFIFYEDGTTDVSGVVNPDGEFTKDITATSGDDLVKITVNKGTIGKTAAGEPLSEIWIIEETTPPTPPEGVDIVLAYDCGPDGTTFDEEIILTFTYDPDEFGDIDFENELVIAVWDGEEWTILEGAVVDTENNTISIGITH
ncbi:helix-turn-helix domain-containing protein, partial [Chloroflexota bacterium]